MFMYLQQPLERKITPVPVSETIVTSNFRIFTYRYKAVIVFAEALEVE
jgi:hypothetical protein